MTDFKQIIGRGTRVAEEYGKTWFTILDYTGATQLFYDPGFDGDPVRVTRNIIDRDGRTVEAQDSEDGTLSPGGLPPEGQAGSPDVSTPGSDQLGMGELPRKFYLDDVAVYIIGETAYELDAENNVLRTVQFTDYVRDTVRRICPSASHLQSLWPMAEQRAEILAGLRQRGIDPDHLAQLIRRPDADPLDLLLHVAFNAPLVSRRERAEKLRQKRPNFFNSYSPAARQILDELLDKYADYGSSQFEKLSVTLTVPPLDRHGTPVQIADRFGGAKQLKSAVDQLQTYLYED